MKKYLNKKTFCLAGAAVLLAGSVTVGSALAYFTTYATASGGAEVSLGFTQTEPEEEVYNKTKHIVISNEGDFECFVRVKILAGEKYKDVLNIYGEGWTQDASADENGFYYYTYKDPVVPGEKTPDELVAEIGIDSVDSTEDFNVIVIQESTPVLYDQEGNPYADWNVILDTVQDNYS